jgi:NADPH:quinone reductase-like Zn-dependent oxidoreductase
VQYLSQAGYSVDTSTSPKNKDFAAKLGTADMVDHTERKDWLVKVLKVKGPYDHATDIIF